MMPARLPNWEARLASLIDDRRAARFEWGTNDCASFASDAVMAITGFDPIVDLRGTYDEREALRRAGRDGHRLFELVPRFLGVPEHPKLAQRGDIVAGSIGPSHRVVLGVCLGAQWAVPGRAGLVFREMADAVSAWRIGW